MITLHDLDEAIKECEGQRSPSANTALKLAAFYTIRNELYPKEEQQTPIASYSYAAPPVEDNSTIDYYSDTDFGRAVEGRETNEVISVIDDLMSVLQQAQPRLHRRILEKIEEL